MREKKEKLSEAIFGMSSVNDYPPAIFDTFLNSVKMGWTTPFIRKEDEDLIGSRFGVDDAKVFRTVKLILDFIDVVSYMLLLKSYFSKLILDRPCHTNSKCWQISFRSMMTTGYIGFVPTKILLNEGFAVTVLDKFIYGQNSLIVVSVNLTHPNIAVRGWKH